MSRILKEYVGDAVYVEFDGFSVILTTEDGISVTNRIVLESFVFRNLMNFMEKLKRTEQGMIRSEWEGEL